MTESVPQWAIPLFAALGQGQAQGGPPGRWGQAGLAPWGQQAPWGKGQGDTGQSKGKGKGAGKGGGKDPGAKGARAGAASQPVWACGSCGFSSNFATRLNCLHCMVPYPFPLPEAKGLQPQALASVAKFTGQGAWAFGPGPKPPKPGPGQKDKPGPGQKDKAAAPTEDQTLKEEEQGVPMDGQAQDGGATPTGPAPGTPELDRMFKAQVDRTEAARTKVAKAEELATAKQGAYGRAV